MPALPSSVSPSTSAARAALRRCAILALVLCAGAPAALAQTAYFSGGQTTVGSGFTEPQGVAVDQNGNLYVADAQNFAIYEVLAVNGAISASPTIRVLASNVGNPQAVAVDSNGDVYFTNLDVYSNLGNNSVNEIVAVNGAIPASPTIVQLGNGLYYPRGVAVDGSGNVYVADTDHGVVKEMLAVNGSVPASPTILTFSTPNSSPTSVALDSSGNLYVFDAATSFGVTDNGAIVELEAVNGSLPSSPVTRILGTGFCGSGGVSVDGNGNVYAANYCSSTISEFVAVKGVIPDSPTIKNVGSNLKTPESVAVDESGDVYVGEAVSSSIPKIPPFTGNFGPLDIGTTSTSGSLPFTFTSTGTLGSIAVLTQGAAGLDYANAGTGTCAANTSYSAGQTCTINVAFAPRFAGPRYGAVQINDTTGNVMATAYLQGTGLGPQLNYSGGAQTTLGSTFTFATNVAVDGSGNAYLVDTINNLGNIQEVMAVNGKIPANPVVKTLLGGLDCPRGLALDAAGDIYYADVCYHTLSEIMAVNGSIPSSPTVRTLTSQVVSPASIAVDSSGNLYVLDANNNTVNEIEAVNGSIPASPTITTLANGFKEVDDIAVDSNGNLYVSDDTNREVFELHAVNGSVPASPSITSLGSGWVIPRGIAVDALGNVYVAEYFYNTVYKLLAVNGSIPASPVIQTLGSGLVYASGVALDSNRNVFVADYGDARLVELDFADPPSLTFASTPVGSTSTESPQPVILENVGNADLSFPIPTTGSNPSIASNFTLAANAPNPCPVVDSSSSSPGTLAAGASCAFSIDFAPTAAGSLNGSLALTDTNLNAAAPGYAVQNIALSGTGSLGTPVITWPAPPAITYGTALSATQLNASANVPGTFVYSPAAGAQLSAGSQTLTVTFTPTDTTDYTTATATVNLTVDQATPTITWPAPVPITYGTLLSATQLNATANVPGTFSYTPLLNTQLSAGTHTLAVLFTPTDTTDYTTANATVQLTVTQATPTITWPAPSPVVYGTALSSAQLDAIANTPGTFVYSPAAGTVPAIGTDTLTVVFTPNDTVDYKTASASVSLVVNPPPSFTLAAAPSSLSIGRGNRASTLISVTGTNGFQSAVTLAASGLPSGVTAGFSPNPTTNSSTLTLTTSKTTTPDTYSVTVTGTSGSLIKSTNIVLTITKK